MTIEKYLKVSLPLTLAGIAFAGYMTSIKLLSGSCAFNESCPTVFNLPTCAYGLIIFSLMFLVVFAALVKKQFNSTPVKTVLGLSAFGILFSGYFAVPEFITVMRGGMNYLLGLPSCAYGLVFYVVIFVVTLKALLKNQR